MMDDSRIIKLYFERSEEAISETEKKYGKYLLRQAENVLGNREDAMECVNDALHQAWNSIPPLCPDRLKFWLGKVVHNQALNIWKHQHRQKRDGGISLLLDELEECIPSGNSVEKVLEDEELGRVISEWLRTLSREDRAMFIRRYWNGEELKRVAEKYGLKEGTAAKKMFGLRESLRAYLEKEGITL